MVVYHKLPVNYWSTSNPKRKQAAKPVVFASSNIIMIAYMFTVVLFHQKWSDQHFCEGILFQICPFSREMAGMGYISQLHFLEFL